MAGFNFADRYKIAGLAPGPEIIGLRQEPFERLRKELTPSRAVELTRLYFGLEPACGFRRRRTAVPIEDGQLFRSIADSIPMIADSR